jgi:hypothetical protein
MGLKQSVIDHSADVEYARSKYGYPSPSYEELLSNFGLLGGCAFSDGKKICLMNGAHSLFVCIPIEEIKEVKHDMADHSGNAYIQINDMKVFPQSHYDVDKGFTAIQKYLEKIKRIGVASRPIVADIEF